MGFVKLGLTLMVAPVLLAALVLWAEAIPALAELRLALGLVLYLAGFASMSIGGLLVLGGAGGLLWQRMVRRKNA